MSRRTSSLLLALTLVAAACSASDDQPAAEPLATSDAADTDGTAQADRTAQADGTAGTDGDATTIAQRWPRPEVPTGPMSEELTEALSEAVATAGTGIAEEVFSAIADSGDPRAAWLVTDLLRFIPGPTNDRLIGVYVDLTGAGVDPFAPWPDATDQLIAWDIPAPDGYLELKRQLFTLVEPDWAPFFEGDTVDWRHVSWGGVLIDDRPLGDPNPCVGGCIPALDDPGLTDAAGGDWYPDDRVVFGVVVNGEARAYPKNIMEIHEMVNDTLGGRRIGVPYCTLCGSAQAYYLDDVEGFEPVLRTSGLLIRSNKMMYDLSTFSLVDTFTGQASTGPLAEAGVTLEQVSVVTSTWGAWKEAHPDTTIVASDGGIGRTYSMDPLGGRDDDGPIFPIGDPDPRLPVQEPVLGVVTDTGAFVAVPVEAARAALAAGDEITIDNLTIIADAGGIRAVRPDGSDAGSHQAFWFAWSQFHPDTSIWSAE
jgi:hypothetical protein